MSRRDRWIVLFCSLLYVASQANIALMTLPLKPDVLAFQLTFSPASFWSIIDAWGPSGVALYRAHMPFDMLHPFIYGALGILTGPLTASSAGITAAVLCGLIASFVARPKEK